MSLDNLFSEIHAFLNKPKPVLYSGGESSRVYDGEYFVRATFRWDDGVPEEHDTEPTTYEACMEWLAAAPFVPLIVVRDGMQYQQRIERAVIMEAQP